MFQQPRKTQQPDSLGQAYNYAIYLLGLSMRTDYEMQRKLAVKGYNPEVVEQIVALLYEEKLLDDRHYLEVYLNNLKEYRTFGYYGIKKKLSEKHLPQEDIEQLLEQELTPEAEQEIAQRFLAKQLGDYKKSALTQEQKQKLAQKLQARGFRMNVIAKLMF